MRPQVNGNAAVHGDQSDRAHHELTQLMARIAEDSRHLTETAAQEADRLRQQAKEELERAEAAGASLVEQARTDAEALRRAVASELEAELHAAREARKRAQAELDTATAARHESEQVVLDARERAVRLIGDTERECTRILDSSKQTASGEYQALQDEFQGRLLQLREVLGVTCAAIDRLIAGERRRPPASGG